MTTDEIKDRLFRIAERLCQNGPGFAQEGLALREARQQFPAGSLEHEQEILDCWHDLFREGRLGWGYNLANPGFPFFHISRSGQNGAGRPRTP